MRGKTGNVLFQPAASNYVLFEDAERFLQEPTVRDERPRHLRLHDPKAVYLIYLEFDSHGQLIVRQVNADLGRARDPSAIEQTLFNLAAGGTAHATNFEKMEWDQSTYLTFVINGKNNPNWRFYWRDDDRRHNPIRFFRRKDSIPRTGRIYQDNNSFFEGRVFELDDGNGNKHHAFRCINFVCDEQGPLRQRQVLHYCFQIYLEAPFRLPGGGQNSEKRITMLIDPDGQNQGPPVRLGRPARARRS